MVFLGILGSLRGMPRTGEGCAVNWHALMLLSLPRAYVFRFLSGWSLTGEFGLRRLPGACPRLHGLMCKSPTSLAQVLAGFL